MINMMSTTPENNDNFKQNGDLIWNIANLLRGPYRPPQYRRVMIPLTVLRRLDCVLEGNKVEVLAYYQQLKTQKKHDADLIEKMIEHKFKLPFYNTSEFTFTSLLADPDKLAAVNLHPNTLPNHAMGQLFEQLVRRFNEPANEEAGDHFTPREVINLMVRLRPHDQRRSTPRAGRN
jgi:type I restriction enzyme M protein